MKLRLKSHSVRFRITTEELEQLAERGTITCGTTISNSSGNAVIFRYEIRRTEEAGPSELHVMPDGFSLWLNLGDYAELVSAGSEGVYLRRPWSDEQGRSQRCVIYVEKDKPKDRKKHNHKKLKHKKHTHEENSSVPHGAEVATSSDSLNLVE
jgi:hypothetical protein